MAFVACQIVAVPLSYYVAVEKAKDGVFGASKWEMYLGITYYVSQQSSTVSLIVLAVTKFCQTNAKWTGAPPGLSRWKNWKMPGFTYPKAQVFWLCTGLLLVSWMTMVFTI